jgi:hypothetical protein
VRRALAGIVLAGGLLAGCTGSPGADPHHQAITPSPTASPSTSPSISSALWGFKKYGTGPTVLVTGFPASQREVTVRWTCVGPGTDTQVRSTKGGLFVGTRGCGGKGVIYEARFARNARRDPARIQIKVDPGVTWAVEVWAGDYVDPVASPTTA